MKKVIWVASYGPDRSHDTLHSKTFDRKKDAESYIKGRDYWRLSRLEYTSAYGRPKRVDQIGGVDVAAEVERVRQQEQYKTGRRVTQQQALSRWRTNVRRHHGPGGRMANPSGQSPKIGGRSPWGKIQHVSMIVPGKVWHVSTASHGGVKISRALQEKLPKKLRNAGGWYEEDVDWALIPVAFPDLFGAKEVDAAHKVMRDWRPNEYRDLTGIEAGAKTSFKMQQRMLLAKHRNDWVTRSAFGSWHADVPPGMVGVIATKGGKPGPERYFLVGENRYYIGPIGYVVDPAKDIEVSTRFA